MGGDSEKKGEGFWRGSGVDLDNFCFARCRVNKSEVYTRWGPMITHSGKPSDRMTLLGMAYLVGKKVQTFITWSEMAE